MHFGLYLKKKRIVTAEQLVAALEKQLSSLVPIGQLALEEGMLSARHIFEILLAQSASPSERFGELAIEMRLLTREQVTHLLMLQADRKRPLSEILIEQGVLTKAQVDTELAAYRQSMLHPERTVTRKIVPAPRSHAAERPSLMV